MIEIRLRNRLRAEDLEPKTGMVLGPTDYDVVLTGAARVLKPNGTPLCVYLPGVLRKHTLFPPTYEVLHSLRKIVSDNRGLASGTVRLPSSPDGKRTRSRNTPSTIIGMMDPAGQQRYCRLTAWTGQNVPEFAKLSDLLGAVAAQFREHVPDRYAIQMGYVRRTDPAWVIPGTPFTTVTVNNTYPTGMHQDKGDLAEGYSTIACLRRGHYTGGRLMFPEWRVAVDLRDGDLILMDAHEWHANEDIYCACSKRLFGMCEECGAERISVVSYYREKMAGCGSAAEEADKAAKVRAK